MIKESEAPKWAQSFDIPVIDADSDLITVQLWQDIEPGNATSDLLALPKTPKNPAPSSA